jgi:2-polyprenyl-6-methoxyphenol hydroxylase-like FAD-dependent oxidoreductase
MITRRLLVLTTRRNHCCPAATTTATTWHSFSSSSSSAGERLRVAIIGGGAAGLSTALHLAPLVAQGYISGPIDVYEKEAQTGREIGVGIWSTALDPFLNSKEESHQLVYRDMTKQGVYIRDVGYRSPKGHWLAESRIGGENLPDLLFLREMDMLAALRKAVHLEEHRGTVKLHTGKSNQVDSIFEASTEPWAAPLMLHHDKDESFRQKTARDYHLIVAADGMNSVIRKTYGGHLCRDLHLTGTTALPSPLELPNTKSSSDSDVHSWNVTGQAEATITQDRQYTVFRGNAHLTSQDLGVDRKSFQTWGEGRSMRFATVPMLYPKNGKREERQVWFITINDDAISSEPDPTKRRDLLLKAFEDWHDPIGRLVKATFPQDILMERAMAHKHSMSPVANFNGIIRRIRNQQPPSAGNGPAIVFVGDAFMTVDPILAQGFTFGMEGAAALATCLQTSLQTKSEYPRLAFDPYVLRDELKAHHKRRLSRLICLLRATELVQALGQPTGGTLSGWLSRDILRPLMRLTPGFIKTPVFNFMLKYSLGLRQSSEGKSPTNDNKEKK